MLRDVIEYVMDTHSLTREAALRAINRAWAEYWNSDDLPNSIFSISLTPIDAGARISLPWYVGKIRGAKQNYGYGRERIELNTPRPWYQDDTYFQGIFTWRLLGTTPLKKSITNATTLTFTFDEELTEPVMVSTIGPNDNGASVRDQIEFEAGDVTKQGVLRYTDLTALAKDKITLTNLRVLDASGAEIAMVPNNAFDAHNQIVQITDKCFVACTFCQCFDILFKLSPPYLYYDETPVPFETVLMQKTSEWITMPKDGQEQKTIMFGTKSRELLTQFNADDGRGVEHKLDIGTSLFNKRYTGYL